MGLLDNITYSPGESMQDFYDKLNLAIDAINNALGGTSTKVKIVNIGDWNMDADASVSVAHGIADYKKIRSITAVVREDADTTYYSSAYTNAGGTTGFGPANITNTDVVLARVDAGSFDNTNFNSTSFNRGWITITYVE